VVPVWNQKQQIVGVLDIDSREFDAFDEIDVENLQKITQLIYHL
jgi:GAF domain-containing protein